MDSINESKRKPRRTKGTPSFYYRNRFAYAVIGTGITLFAIFSLTPIYEKSNDKLKKRVSVRPVEEYEKRRFFEFGAPRTPAQIRKTIAEKKQFESER